MRRSALSEARGSRDCLRGKNLRTIYGARGEAMRDVFIDRPERRALAPSARICSNDAQPSGAQARHDQSYRHRRDRQGSAAWRTDLRHLERSAGGTGWNGRGTAARLQRPVVDLHYRGDLRRRAHAHVGGGVFGHPVLPCLQLFFHPSAIHVFHLRAPGRGDRGDVPRCSAHLRTPCQSTSRAGAAVAGRQFPGLGAAAARSTPHGGRRRERGRARDNPGAARGARGRSAGFHRGRRFREARRRGPGRRSEALDPILQTAMGRCWANLQAGGDGSVDEDLRDLSWHCLPLALRGRALGVACLRFPVPLPQLAPEQSQLLEAMLRDLAQALARTRLVRQLEAARVQGETERLRAALLSSVSHDLRSPLSTIIGSAESLSALPRQAVGRRPGGIGRRTSSAKASDSTATSRTCWT